MTGTEARLARIRGRAVPKSHNARTIAALASNPGCARRAILDAAGTDKQRIAAYTGFPAPFGQSRFALARGNAFEAQLKAEGAAQLLTLLRETLNLPIDEAHYHDISDVGGVTSPEARHARTRSLLTGPAVTGTMFDHPLLRLEVGGRHAYLEPDLIAFQVNGQYRVLEIKSFPVIDGQADGEKVAAAATRRSPERGVVSTLRSLARAIAVERQHAQPVCTVRHVHISDRPLVFIPLALAGEACAPLAAMVGDSPDAPRLLIVPEPRDRDQRFATARFTGDGRALSRAKAALAEALRTQLEPTWALMWRAVELLRVLPEGAHVPMRWSNDRAAYEWHVNHLRDGGPPQAKRDGAVSAARRLASLERVQEMLAVQRAYDDPLVMAEYRMTGEAFAGTVVAAEPDRVDSTGKRRVLRPRITVETGDPLTVEPGALLTSPARPAQEARVVTVGRGTVMLELKGGMGRSLAPEPGSVPAVGEQVCYATFNDGFQRLPEFPLPEETPWTHGGPPPPYVPRDEDATEAWS